MKKIAIFTLLLALSGNFCAADGCLPGDPCYESPKVAAPVREMVPPPPSKPSTASPVASKVIIDEDCDWGSRIAIGSPVWFFQEEDTEVGGGIYGDLYPCNYPVNFRIGAEISHIGADQSNALDSAEFPGKPVRLTFIRIPLAVEYVAPLSGKTKFFIGGGPDIIRTANDVSDTSVGLHLSARVLHNFNEHIGLALEAGYMWGEVNDDGGGDIDLDNTFVIPTLSYTF